MNRMPRAETWNFATSGSGRREVDFVIVERRAPRLMVECKWADAEVDRSLRYLKARFPTCEAWQVSAVGTKDYVTPDGIRVAPALELLRTVAV